MKFAILLALGAALAFGGCAVDQEQVAALRLQLTSMENEAAFLRQSLEHTSGNNEVSLRLAENLREKEEDIAALNEALEKAEKGTIDPAAIGTIASQFGGGWAGPIAALIASIAFRKRRPT